MNLSLLFQAICILSVICGARRSFDSSDGTSSSSVGSVYRGSADVFTSILRDLAQNTGSSTNSNSGSTSTSTSNTGSTSTVSSGTSSGAASTAALQSIVTDILRCPCTRGSGGDFSGSFSASGSESGEYAIGNPLESLAECNANGFQCMFFTTDTVSNLRCAEQRIVLNEANNICSVKEYGYYGRVSELQTFPLTNTEVIYCRNALSAISDVLNCVTPSPTPSPGVAPEPTTSPAPTEATQVVMAGIVTTTIPFTEIEGLSEAEQEAYILSIFRDIYGDVDGVTPEIKSIEPNDDLIEFEYCLTGSSQAVSTAISNINDAVTNGQTFTSPMGTQYTLSGHTTVPTSTTPQPTPNPVSPEPPTDAITAGPTSAPAPTASPVTALPTTALPTSPDPITTLTPAPVTTMPTTVMPTTGTPTITGATQQPTGQPVTASPVTSMPSTGLPTTGLPTSSPVTALPTTALPSTAVPTMSPSTTAMPTSESPTTEQPTASPTTALPTTALPTSSAPTMRR